MKWKVVAVGLAVLLAALAGCGSSGNTSTSSSQSTGTSSNTEQTATESTSTAKEFEGVTLTLLMDNDSSRDGLTAVAKLIEEKTGIKTEIELRPGGSEGDNVVKTRLATGDMADLVWYNSGSLLQALNPEENFVDLSDQPFMANVADSFKSAVTVNGKVFGIPTGSATAGAWLYNKKVYEELGLSVPHTWEELMENCEKIKAAGIVPVIGSYQTDWTAQLLLLADFYNVLQEVPTFAEDFTANKAKFATTPAALRGFEKLAEVYERGFLNSDFLATDYDTALKMLVEGQGAHYPILTFALENIQAKYPDKINDIGLFGQPGDSADNHGLTLWMPGGIYLNKKTQHLDAALKWMEIYVSPEGINAYIAASTVMGPFAVQGIQLPDDIIPAVKDMVDYMNAGKTAPALEFLSPLKGPNLPQICVEVGSGMKTPLEGAEAYDRDVEKQAQQLALPGW